MSKFNQKKQSTQKVTNFESAPAYSENANLELISLLLTSFAQDQFYRKADNTTTRLRELLKKVHPLFAAQAAVYARTQFGMRSITHILAAELAPYLAGKDYAVSFYNNIIFRPDDMLEIAAYYFANLAQPANNKRHKKGLPKAMANGFAVALHRFDAYSLAKYKGSNKSVKMVDLVNMTHPTPTDALNMLMTGKLPSFDTWESELSKAGEAAESDEEKADFKKEVWISLIREKKIKYFALLRNLRNIIQQAPEVIPEVIVMLTDETVIRKSLILPFRFVTAIDEISKLAGPQARIVAAALSKALDMSLSNIPTFEGSTCVILDESESMTQAKCSTKTVAEVGALFAAVLCKGLNADLVTFDTTARYRTVPLFDSTYTLAKGITFSGGGTHFTNAIYLLNKKYDRLIIISDMQGYENMNGRSDTPTDLRRALLNYKNRYAADPIIHSFDLAGYGTLQFPERKLLCLAGFSDKTLGVMQLLEQDRNALVNEVKKIQL